mmetsp:Transcript_28684/g.60858  ORF Transcript_28684/g.60858 Transcript_28684/m.60858 type:complete len:219 (-) Transcript_28684:739-1395(-)
MVFGVIAAVGKTVTLAHPVQPLEQRIQICSAEVRPHGSAIVGMLVHGHLLSAIVDNGQAVVQHHPHQGVLEQAHVTTVFTQEAVLVVVVDEVAEQMFIRVASLLLPLEHAPPFRQGAAPFKSLAQLHGNGEVEQPLQGRLLVGAMEGNVVADDFPDDVDASSFLELLQEPTGHEERGVQAEAVELILVDHVSDPLQQEGAHLLVLLLDVRQVSKPAFL